MQHSSHRRHCQVSDISPTSPTRLRVLVYEATNDLERMVEAPQSDVLETSFDVEFVSTLSEAVEHVRTEWFDVVLLEFNMSGASPGLLLKRLSDSALTRPTPVVVRSHQPSIEQAVSALTAGAANYLAADELNPQAVWTALESAAATESDVQRDKAGSLVSQAAELGLCASENPVEQYALALTHAVLTPLAAIQEFVSLVLDGVTGPVNDEQGKHLAFARGGCETIRASVLHGLDSARFGSGWDSEHSTINLEKLIGGAWKDACETSAEEHSRPLKIASLLREENVTGDFGYLTELLGSLFQDALSFSGAQNDIEVSISRDTELESDLVVAITTQLKEANAGATENLLRFSNERSYRGVKVTQNVGQALEYRIALTTAKTAEATSQTKIAERI